MASCWTARLDADLFDEIREAQQLGCETFSDAINEAIRLCLPSAIVSVDAQATAVTIAVKDEELLELDDELALEDAEEELLAVDDADDVLLALDDELAVELALEEELADELLL